jgi:hypothetical protein
MAVRYSERVRLVVAPRGKLVLALLVCAALVALSGCQGTPGLVSRIEPPQLVSPPDGAVFQCPPQDEQQQQPTFTFAWTQVRGALFYTLEVYRAADGFLVVSKKVDPGEAGTVTLACGADYLWRVGAVAGYPADPAWSQVWRFSISAPPAGGAGAVRVPARPQ